MGFMGKMKDKMMDKMLNMPKEKQIQMMRDMTALLLGGLSEEEKAGFLNTITLDMAKELPAGKVREILG
jgi:hypothetical protein